MGNFKKGLYGALMGLAAYLTNALIVSLVLSQLGNGLRNFFLDFLSIALLGSVLGLPFLLVGILSAISKGPRAALRPLIITTVIVLTAVGGCFGLLGVY